MRLADQTFMRSLGISFILLLTSRVGLAQGLPEQGELTGRQPSAESQSGQAQPDTAKQEKAPSSTSEQSNTSTNESGQPASAELPQSPNPSNATPSETVQEIQAREPQPQQDNIRKPIGAAAAEKEKTTGIAASNPAGAAIAPAKQRRSRALFIKVGAVLGAGVALGTAMALSRSSPSRPPGSH